MFSGWLNVQASVLFRLHVNEMSLSLTKFDRILDKEAVLRIRFIINRIRILTVIQPKKEIKNFFLHLFFF